MSNREYIPYNRPSLSSLELDGVQKALESLWWSRGERVQEFEKQFRERCGVRYALALNSCTAALHTILLCYDIGRGDEVITTPMTFCSTANVIVHVGATPVFADIDENTGLINLEQVAAKITAKTKAILVVDYAGAVCEMEQLALLCKEHNLKLIEDAAHSFDATYHGKPVGSLADATAFSFYATKNLSTGEGGMLTTDDEALYRRAGRLSLHGLSTNARDRYRKGGTASYEMEQAGYKYNMNDISAAIGLAQLARMDEMQQKRQVLAAQYTAAFAGNPLVTPLAAYHNGVHAWHLYVIKLHLQKLNIDRDAFLQELDGCGIGSSVHFRPVHTFAFYRALLQNNPPALPCAQRFGASILSLPLYPSLTQEEAQYIACQTTKIALAHAK